MERKERRKINMPSAKGKKPQWHRQPGPVATLFAELKRFEPLKEFSFGSSMGKTGNASRIAGIMRLWRALDSEEKYGFEKELLERTIHNVSSSKGRMENLLALDDIAGSRGFCASMTFYPYLISCQKKMAESMRMFETLISNDMFRRRAFYLGLKIISNETIENRKRAFERLESISCNPNFDASAISLLFQMMENSREMDLYWNLCYVNEIMNSSNFSKDIFTFVKWLPDNGSAIHWTLELASALMESRNFRPEWLSQNLFDDLHAIAGRTASDMRNNKSDAFLVIKGFFSSSPKADPDMAARLKKEMEKTEEQIKESIIRQLTL